MTPPPAAMEERATTTETRSCAAALRAGAAAPATQVRTMLIRAEMSWLVKSWLQSLNLLLVFAPQPKTARVTRGRVRTEGRVSEEETPSPASARTAGRDPPVLRVRHRYECKEMKSEGV